MKIPTIDDGYKEAKQKAKLFYSQLGYVWCPALADYVVFDRTGFRHLIQKNRIPRLQSEQKRRFALLIYLKDILESQAVSFSEERRSGKSQAYYWVFENKYNDTVIKLIVRQIGNGKKHFLSIYSKYQKSAR